MQSSFAAPLLCHNCGASTPPKSCSRCKHARYCNEACQRADWGYHRMYCYATAKEASESVFAALFRRKQEPSYFLITKRGVHQESGEFGAEVGADISTTIQNVVRNQLALEYTLMSMYERAKVTRIVILRRPQADNPVTAVKIRPFMLCDHGATSPTRCEIERIRSRGYIPFLIGMATNEGTPAEYITTLVCAIVPRPVPADVAKLTPQCEHTLKACMLLFHPCTGGATSRVSAMCQELAKGLLGNTTKCDDPACCSGFYDYTCETVD